MTESPLMQAVDRETVDALKTVIAALERDKKTLASQLRNAEEHLKTVREIINSGDKVNYCYACGVFHATVWACDCSQDV